MTILSLCFSIVWLLRKCNKIKKKESLNLGMILYVGTILSFFRDLISKKDGRFKILFSFLFLTFPSNQTEV